MFQKILLLLSLLTTAYGQTGSFENIYDNIYDDNGTYYDCAGTPNGYAVFDACNVCDGDGSSCDHTLRNWIIVCSCIVLAACCGCQIDAQGNKKTAFQMTADRRVYQMESQQMESQVKPLIF